MPPSRSPDLDQRLAATVASSPVTAGCRREPNTLVTIAFFSSASVDGSAKSWRSCFESPMMSTGGEQLFADPQPSAARSTLPPRAVSANLDAANACLVAEPIGYLPCFALTRLRCFRGLQVGEEPVDDRAAAFSSSARVSPIDAGGQVDGEGARPRIAG